MSTTSPAPAPVPTLDISQTAPVPFSRLVRVEWRKMLDTRGGFWLMIATAILLVITVGLVLLVVALNDDPIEIGANGFSQILTIPLSLLLPVFPILSVTSEWGQRTGLVTFSLEPNRVRVLLAKVTSVVLLALATIVVALVLGALGNVVAAAMDGTDVVWDLELDTLLLTILLQLLYFLMAYAFGTVFLSSPAAIAVFYVVALMLPLLVYSTLYAIFDWAQDIIPWIDLQYAMTPLLDPDDDATTMDGLRILVTVLIWIVTPLVIGTRRVLSSEPK
ncbi:ABC transporter permease [Nocardioides lijunqiniae]|uniref:ABC transporter permease n=1 Tax=Nocardioides lijunqiniae TaxID=2760832 RepID=UPI001877DB2D|nr:ABC transporter permease [Nocardioides lijunqiniae]